VTLVNLLEIYKGPNEPKGEVEGETPLRTSQLMRISRVWCFLTGWERAEIEQSPEDYRKKWIEFLDWPPDVFALCAAVLKRSGAYTRFQTAGGYLSEKELRDRARCWQGRVKNKRYALPAIGRVTNGEEDRGSNNSLWQKVESDWLTLWACRHIPLHQIATCPDLLKTFIETLALADETSSGSGLPLRRQPAKGASEYALIERGWQLLEPSKHGSSLCTDRIHPSAARVLPKMHTPRTGLTLRSFSHHLAYCESDEVQPRWFMVPGARGDVANTHHINLLVIPWPAKTVPSSINRSRANSGTLREGAPPGRYFTYQVDDTCLSVADHVDALCQEAQRVLGSLDGVILPELALTMEDYKAVRDRVLARSAMLLTGVGTAATDDEPGQNQLCLDVPLSRHHAAHFVQQKQHRWCLDGQQIRAYGLGSRLSPLDSYWEDIEIGDRRLLFLVLRPWLVTSVLICEDLARHDPVAELLRGVGPHLVIALLMDGPQLLARWSNRYATALADDPGCSVVSVTSLGMAELSRVDAKTPPSRIVALWKDPKQGAATEIAMPPGADAMALTISVETTTEVSADAREDGGVSAIPVLSGIHAINRPAINESIRREDVAQIRILAAHEAAALARLVQQNTEIDPGPTILSELSGEAAAIGKEIWRLKPGASSTEDFAKRLSTGDYADLPTMEQTETASRIVQWFTTNLAFFDPPVPKTPAREP
jgi:hypothetical protein